jgi:hypothetical protein
MKKQISKLVIKNIAYQYLDNQKLSSSYKQLIIFLRDLFFIKSQLEKIEINKKIIILTDTNAADIVGYIENICTKSKDTIHPIVIKKTKKMDIGLLTNCLLWIIIEFVKIITSTPKLFINYRRAPLPLLEKVFLKYLAKNFIKYTLLFNQRRCIVFYEKSILSMIVYLYADRFEVIQHGNPTDTYWPSLADIYYAWNQNFRKLILTKFDGEIRISGYPGKIKHPKQEKEKFFDILFLSQYGSSQELIEECRQIKQYINYLSTRGLRILVKLHPRERANDLQFAPGIVIANPTDKIEDLFSISSSVCSYYSTALLLAIYSKCAVFRISLDARLIQKDFPFLSDIPEICITEKLKNPVEIAKKININVNELDCHAFE